MRSPHWRHAASVAAHAARITARALARTAAYVGPLLLAALVYLWRVTADTVSSVQYPARAWRARRPPEGAASLERWRSSVAERRTKRWASWTAVPALRRIEIRAAALALVIIAFAGIRLWWRSGKAAPPQQASTTVPADADRRAPSASVDETRPISADVFLRNLQSAPSQTWVLLSSPVLAPNPRSAWDDFRIGSPVVMKQADRGLRMWFAACRVAGLEYDCGVGHATSADGVTWRRGPAPVFSPGLAKPFWLSSIAVVSAANRYFLWYSVNAHPFGEQGGRRLTTIHLATSGDGLVWRDEGLVLTAQTEATRAIDHAVVHDGHLFHLWYVDLTGHGETTGAASGPALLHYTSRDGKGWTPAGGDSGDGLMSRIGRPWITWTQADRFRALVADRGEPSVLRWLTSPDGARWTVAESERDLPMVSDETIVSDATGLREPAGLWLWTTLASRHRAVDSIGVAFKKGAS